MAPEPNLKKTDADNEWQRLRHNLQFSVNWLNNEIRAFLAPFGITQKQYNILRILRCHDADIPLSILDIRNRMVDKMSDASRIIDRLHQKELIEKKPCTMDKRATRIYISKSGQQLLRKIDNQSKQLDAVTQTLSLEEAQQLNALLDKLHAKS